jgi:ElaB/YqjD/DUF883 family membrane-anchored ribosome-binding protein
MTEQHQAYDRPRHIPTFSERLAGAARAQPAGLLLLFAGTSLLLSGMRPPSAATARRARGAVRKIAQGDFSDEGSTVSSAREGASDMASGVRDQIGDLGNKAGELARTYTESLSGLADDAQEALRDRSQRLAEAARSSAQSSVSFVLEDQPLLLAAIGLAAGATLGAMLPSTPQENRLMGETRDKVAEFASETAKQKVDELGSAASEATERLKSAVKDRVALSTEDLGEVAKDVIEPFANVASGSGSASSAGKPSQGSAASGQGSGGVGSGSGGSGTGGSGGSGTASSGTASSGTASSGTASSGTGSSGGGSSASVGKIS